MSEQKKKIIGKDVIGIDGSNIGFSLSHFVNFDLPVIKVGYLYRNYPGSQTANGLYEAKGGLFSTDGPLTERELLRIRTYISMHPDFFYTTIQKRETRITPMHILKAHAISALILGFFQRYPLHESKTTVVLDMVHNPQQTEQLKDYLDSILKKENIQVPIIYRYKADFYNQAVKFCDRIGYYLLALRFRGKRNKWPYRMRKIDFRNSINFSSRKQKLDL